MSPWHSKRGSSLYGEVNTANVYYIGPRQMDMAGGGFPRIEKTSAMISRKNTYQRWLKEIREGFEIKTSQVAKNMKVIAATEDEDQKEACMVIAAHQLVWLQRTGEGLVDQLAQIEEQARLARERD